MNDNPNHGQLDLGERHTLLLRCLEQRDADGAKGCLARITGRWPELTIPHRGIANRCITGAL